MKRLQISLVVLALLTLSLSVASAEVLFEDNFDDIPDGVSEAEALQMYPFGWVPTGAGKQWTLRLSDVMAFSGKYSMEITVNPNNEPWGVHISSRPIPVEPGKEYTASIMLFNVDDELYNQRTDLYLEFWPEEGWWGETDYWTLENWKNQVLGQWTNKNRLHHVAKSSPLGQWVEVTATAVAPPGAKYATISLWTSRKVLKSYIDNVRFEVSEP